MSQVTRGRNITPNSIYCLGWILLPSKLDIQNLNFVQMVLNLNNYYWVAPLSVCQFPMLKKSWGRIIIFCPLYTTKSKGHSMGICVIYYTPVPLRLSLSAEVWIIAWRIQCRGTWGSKVHNIIITIEIASACNNSTKILFP
jgi:hypothetical protein